MNEKEDVKIDYDAIFSSDTIINKIVDKALAEIISSLMPDENTKKICLALLSVHRKYGIDTMTSIKILKDIGYILKEDKK